MTDIWRHIASLPLQKRQLLFRRLRQSGYKFNVFPLSFAQRRLWFLDQLAPGNPAYNIAAAIRLTGPLWAEAVQSSLNAIVRRHSVLRARFLLLEEEPVQVISPTLTIPLVVEQFTAACGAAQEALVQAYLTAEARRPFDLTCGPLLRMYLLRLAEDEHILFTVMHHSVSDGWSTLLFLHEFKALYRALVLGKPSPLPELPIQYTDFAVWQRQHFQGQALAVALSYWKQQLSGPLPALELPTDRLRPTVQTYRGATQTFTLPLSLSRALKDLSRREGVTLFMTLLAACKTLLHRYTGQDDIIVGSPISGRSRPETRGLIGLFVNTLVLRTDLSNNPTFRELLSRVRKVCVGATAHQQLPFEKLVETLQPQRNLSHTPLFHVMFVFQDVPEEFLEFHDLTITPLEVDSGTAKFDLTLSFMRGVADGLSGSLEYNTDLFTHATIARMLGHLRVLLESLVANPAQRLSEASLLTEAEQHQLVGKWNKTTTDYPRDQCVHRLFETQTNRTPYATAVLCEQEQLCYEALNRRANQLAHYLQKRGVGPEVLVGIYVERSLEMVEGILGILKAGGAYVPLDPAYPQERLAFMLADSQAPVLLTQERLAARLPRHGAQVLRLDADWKAIAHESDKNPASEVAAENLAYVIYTSGSTGKPKGVQISHRAVVNLLTAMSRRPGITDRDTLLAVTSLSFDIAALELFLPLIVGARLVVVSREVACDGTRLLAALHGSGATIMQATPSTWRLLLAAGWQGSDQLTILCGGEALPQQLAHQLREQGASLWNLYGPTETTIWSTVYQVSSTDRPIPIGRPIANTEIYLLDQHLQLVPIGVSGELHIGGAGLARGYLNRPELTAEKFIPHPFSHEPGARLYKTGDLARYLPDGNLEFLGRIDQQVKIRGFRIEPGEVESVLGQHPAIRETVVVAREDIPGDKRLVAYVVVHRHPVPSISELHRFLKEKLPDSMVPAAFVFLDTLPLTPNGKVDRRALPPPHWIRPNLEKAYTPPRTLLEKRLVELWTQVLGVKEVGIHDNFFELGGHSLQAVQLAAQISAAVERDISVKSIFLFPTIAALAETLRKESPVHTQDRVAGKVGAGPYACPAPGQPQGVAPTSVTKIEHRPLLPLFLAGQLAPVHAAAVASLPYSLLSHAGLDPDEIIHGWCGNLPVVSGIYETSLGRIALVLLPRFSFQLYSDREDLLRVLIQALETAGRLGAHTVSLTGLLPSATDYGRDLARVVAGRSPPQITTGHATTAATVVFAVKRILQEGGRDLAQEHVGVLGLGSIGVTTLRLLLTCLPHPAAISLCDVYRKRSSLEALRRELADDWGFRGIVHILESPAEVPSAFYNATLIIGATNVPDILDIARVQPGTLIVDDSAPHCFTPPLATRRFLAQEDILFTEGGVLRLPHAISRLLYVPRAVEKFIDITRLAASDPYEITGCIFSSLLSARFAHLSPTLGFADNTTCLRHYQILSRLGSQAAHLQCEDYVLAEASIRNFRHRFGSSKDPYVVSPPEILRLNRTPGDWHRAALSERSHTRSL
jgi:amino acid adenylation domain-containing protein